MAGKGDALVVIGADTKAIKKAAAETVSAWKDVGRTLSSSIGDATESVLRDLSKVVTAQGQVSFSSQLQQVRSFEASTARMAVATNRSFESVRRASEVTGIELGKRPEEVNAWATEVGKLTGNFEGAGKAIKGVTGFAALTNRSAEEYKGLAVEIQTVGAVGGDTTHALGVLAAQADALGTVGGPGAFADQVQGLQEVISHFAVKSEADFLRVTAAAATFGKGLSAQQSQRVQQSILGMTTADPYLLKRMLGHEVVDKQGHVKDAVGTAFEIRDFIKKKYGSGSMGLATLARMPGMSYESASALMHADRGEAEKAAKLAPSAAPQQALSRFLGSDAGKRETADAQLAVSSRELLGSSTKLGRAADALQRFAASHPVASTLASTAAAGITGAVAGAIGKTATLGIRGGLGLLGGGLKTAGLGIGGATLAGGALLVGAGAAGAYGIHKFDQAEQEREKIQARERDSAAGGQLNLRLIALRKANAASHQVTGLTPQQQAALTNASSSIIAGASSGESALALTHGTGTAEALTRALHKAGGTTIDDATIAKMANAFAEAVKNNLKVEVKNDSDTALTATTKNAHKGASQAHP